MGGPLRQDPTSPELLEHVTVDVLTNDDLLPNGLFALAGVYMGQGREVEAETMYQEMLTTMHRIYGEEDWSASIRKVEEDVDEGAAVDAVALQPPQPDRDRMAGLT